MEILQKAIEHVAQGLPHQFLSQLLANKLAAQGIRLSARERKLLDRRIREGGGDTFRIKRWSFWDRRQIEIRFTPQEIEQAEHKFTDFIENRLTDLIQEVAEDTSKTILSDLRRKWRTESSRQQRESTGFAKRLRDRWGIPLEALRMLLTISRELGATINDRIRSSPERNHKNLIEVLTRCHARSCQITEEIICLMAAGFADGAMARWRSLHEIAVVALFVSANGERLAERYVLHQAVESKRAADEYAKYRERLGCEPLDTNEIKALENSFAALKARFGKDFSNPYGWAAHHLQIPNPKFTDIERAAGIDHLRPYYRMATHNIHANPKSVFFKLGLLEESDILLAGPSVVGLTDPGHGAAISLAQVSSTLYTLHPTFDNLVALKIILQLVEEIGEAFGQAHVRLEVDAARLRTAVRKFSSITNP